MKLTLNLLNNNEFYIYYLKKFIIKYNIKKIYIIEYFFYNNKKI